jgi:hypothetical protein
MSADETAPFLDSKGADDARSSAAAHPWHRALGFLLAAAIGAGAGALSRTLRESWLYAAVFCVEGLICIGLSVAVKSGALRQALAGFCGYFAASGLIAVVVCAARTLLA